MIIDYLKRRFMVSADVDVSDLEVFKVAFDEACEHFEELEEMFKENQNHLDMQMVTQLMTLTKSVIEQLSSCNIYVSMYIVKRSHEVQSLFRIAVSNALRTLTHMESHLTTMQTSESWHDQAVRYVRDAKGHLTRIKGSI